MERDLSAERRDKLAESGLASDPSAAPSKHTPAGEPQGRQECDSVAGDRYRGGWGWGERKLEDVQPGDGVRCEQQAAFSVGTGADRLNLRFEDRSRRKK